MSTILTVTQVNTFIKSLIDGDGRLRNILICGEISNLTDHYKSGHIYFSLKDSGGVIKAVMFADSAKRLKFRPADGMKVIVGGRVSVYEATGQYQVYVQSMQPDGIGALNLAYEQLKERLEKSGMFNKHWEIPRFPQKIGVITSATGAAYHDIIQILARRWPVAEVIFCPSAVQGELAVPQLLQSMDRVMQEGADVIIIGRGGGSIEDLWAFNSEELAKKIFDCKIPVISAVGHETDFTICDFVADLRAPTPSAAAELAVPDIYEVMSFFENSWDRLNFSAESLMENKKLLLDNLTSAKVLSSPTGVVDIKRNEIANLSAKLAMVEKHIVGGGRVALAEISGKLHELSPLKILARGYSLLTDEQNLPVTSVSAVEVGHTVNAILGDGSLTLKVQEVVEKSKKEA